MKVRVEIMEISEFNNDDERGKGRHAIFEQDYDGNREDDDLLAHIEMQLEEWEEDEAKRIMIEESEQRLAEIVGFLLENIPSQYHPGRNQIEYDGEGEEARFIMGSPFRNCQITVKLR